MSLLGIDEPPPFEVVSPGAPSPWLLLCDHASNHLPRKLGSLGLDDAQRRAHIAWDIGAAKLARFLSAQLDAPLVLSGYSRLAIDCNRPLDAQTSIPAVTCDVRVPGNEALGVADRRVRADELFWPYHRAVEETLAARDAGGRTSVILSVHSFTPSLYGEDRPWHFGVMYGRDRRLAAQLIEALSEEPEWVVGDNEPYRVTDASDYGIPVYAEQAGRLGLLLEVRQDLISEASGLERVGRSLVRALRRIPSGTP